MKAPDFETQTMVEPVGGMVGRIAVQNQDLAVGFPGEFLEVADHSGADPRRPENGIDHQRVDFKIAPAPDLGGDPCTADTGEAITGKRAHDAIMRMVTEDRFQAFSHEGGRRVGIEGVEKS